MRKSQQYHCVVVSVAGPDAKGPHRARGKAKPVDPTYPISTNAERVLFFTLRRVCKSP